MKLAQILLLFIMSLFFAANTLAANEKLNFKELEIQLSSPKEAVLFLEPFQITVILRNKFGNAIMPNSKPELSQSDVQLKIDYNGKISTLSDISDSIATLLSYEEIKTTEKELHYKIVPRLNTSFSAGEHSFRLTFHKGKERLTSNLLTITIAEPLGIDKEIFDELKTLPNFSSLLNMPSISEEVGLVNKVIQLTNKSPQSVYSNYINFILAEMAISLGNADLAITKYTELINKNDFPFIEVILQRMQEIYSANNDSFMVNYYQEKLDKLDLENNVTVYF